MGLLRTGDFCLDFNYGGKKMYEKMVVPLDGSKLAECVLPYVEELAKGCGTKEVILVSVTESIAGYKTDTEYRQSPGPFPSPEPVTRVGVTVGKKQEQAQKYLGRIAKRLGSKGIQVRTKVLLGNPAQEIADFVEHDDADIIVMASHGRSGISRWANGSVADKVFRASRAPVLMVRAPGYVPGI
ncbi:universal stress protein [Chloroflexota bacterium]